MDSIVIEGKYKKTAMHIGCYVNFRPKHEIMLRDYILDIKCKNIKPNVSLNELYDNLKYIVYCVKVSLFGGIKWMD